MDYITDEKEPTAGLNFSYRAEVDIGIKLFIELLDDIIYKNLRYY